MFAPSLPCTGPDNKTITNKPQKPHTTITNTKYHLGDWLADHQLHGVAGHVHGGLARGEVKSDCGHSCLWRMDPFVII